MYGSFVRGVQNNCVIATVTRSITRAPTSVPRRLANPVDAAVLAGAADGSSSILGVPAPVFTGWAPLVVLEAREEVDKVGDVLEVVPVKEAVREVAITSVAARSSQYVQQRLGTSGNGRTLGCFDAKRIIRFG